MNNIALTIIFTAIVNFTFAQAENATSKVIGDNFEKNYNSGDFEAVFNMFSSDFQNALPIDKTSAFLKNLQDQAGKITKREFVKYDKSVAIYKTKFERALFSVNISVDNNSKINGLLIKPYIEDNSAKSERNSTKLDLPFKGEWTVVWGGDTEELNYHVINQAQKNAFDIVITDEKGNTHKGDGIANEDYYAFGKDLFAPCDGEIVLVVDGVKDNVVGEMNTFNVGGNTIIIKTPNNEFLVFSHFKHRTIQVKEGQQIKKGQLLGQCGNTGNSSEPHIHFHIQNAENMKAATGIKCYFEKLIVNGQTKTDYSPIQKDKIKSD